MQFNFKGHLYELTFNDKSILKEDGIEISNKTLTVLRKYINANNINISFVNGRGNLKNTNIIVKDFLKFHEPDLQVGIRNKKIKSKVKKEKKAKVEKSISSQNADLLVEEKIKGIQFEKMSGKNKLLIIPCSGSKLPGGNINHIQDYFLQNNAENLYGDLVNERPQRMDQYVAQLNNNPAYFEKKGGAQRFMNLLNEGNLLPAFERYAGNRSNFYKPALTNLYREKNLNSNLHILIISGLYGVLEFRDTILDYHLEISKANACWKNQGNFTLREVVTKYIHANEIENENVFYAVSPSDYEKALKPLEIWQSLWVHGGRNSNSVSCVKEFLERI